MLIDTSQNVYENLSTVVSDLMTSIYPYLTMIIGIIIALYLLSILIRIIRPDNDKYTYDEHGNIKYIEFDK